MINPRHAFARLFSDCLDLLYPRQCLMTGKPVGDGELRYLCEDAAAQITFIQEPYCHTCGAPFYGVLVGPRSCPACRELDPAFQSGRTIWLLRHAGRKLIHELKYHGATYLLDDLETLMRRARWLPDFLNHTHIVPVPLHTRKRRQRGFNQAELLAQRLARLNDTCTVAPILQRTEDTESQTRLDRSQRWRNVKNAFALTPEAEVEKNTRYLVVDDVFTTGATLNACCKTLAKNGATDLRVLTLAHG